MLNAVREDARGTQDESGTWNAMQQTRNRVGNFFFEAPLPPAAKYQARRTPNLV